LVGDAAADQLLRSAAATLADEDLAKEILGNYGTGVGGGDYVDPGDGTTVRQEVDGG
jgi:hypothetical protein